MLSSRDEVKAYIGSDVILAKCPSPNNPGIIEIVVGHLYDYCYLAQDLPFGTAVMLGAAQFSVDISADEYRTDSNSWSISTREQLELWAKELPKRMEFLETQLPAGSTMQDIHGVITVVKMDKDVLTAYFEEAKKLWEANNDTNFS